MRTFNIPLDNRKTLWDGIVQLLSLSQLSKTMGDDYRTYQSKALRVKQISKNKTVHTLADQLLDRCKILQKQVTYFQGMALPRNAIVKELVQQHIIAVHEYDHTKADKIESVLAAIHREMSYVA